MGLAVSWVIYMIIHTPHFAHLVAKTHSIHLLDFLKDVLPYLPTACA